MTTASSSSSAAEQAAPALAGDGRPGRVPQRTVVIDLGSNTFRLVVFSAVRGTWWRRSDEICDGVRIGAGEDATGALSPEAVDRALHTLDMYAGFLRASLLVPEQARAVATSAIRDASNRAGFVRRAEAATGLRITVLSADEEAWYGYLGAVNSTTLRQGLVLDLGGGSLQLTRVKGRAARRHASWALGTVRMTERFLPDARARRKQIDALRKHVRQELRSAAWVRGRPNVVGIGGTVRNLAAAAQRAHGLPKYGVQGFVLERGALDELVDELAGRPSADRGNLPGIKPARGDVILAGAVTVQAALDVAEADAIEVTGAGLREGVFFASHLAPADPPLFEDVRAASVRNLAAQFEADLAHADHVARLALGTFDALADAGLHAGDPVERELLWAAALLHDIGASVDYDDHHKHSRYLVLASGLPGFSARETALVAQMTRYHRKGVPELGEFASLARPGDRELLRRCAALLRLAEQLERSRDQLVRETTVELADGAVALGLVGTGDLSVACWSAERERDVFELAFGRPLQVVA